MPIIEKKHQKNMYLSVRLPTVEGNDAGPLYALSRRVEPAVPFVGLQTVLGVCHILHAAIAKKRARGVPISCL